MLRMRCHPNHATPRHGALPVLRPLAVATNDPSAPASPGRVFGSAPPRDVVLGQRTASDPRAASSLRGSTRRSGPLPAHTHATQARPHRAPTAWRASKCPIEARGDKGIIIIPSGQRQSRTWHQRRASPRLHSKVRDDDGAANGRAIPFRTARTPNAARGPGSSM
jgi:hypothetical protein